MGHPRRICCGRWRLLVDAFALTREATRNHFLLVAERPRFGGVFFFMRRNGDRRGTLKGFTSMRRSGMDREHVKGTADKAKGAIKEGAGKLMGDKSMEAEGKMDKAKGAAHNAAGDVKDAARDAADALKK
jgi:uncharacterized protein YjbJ (UPF0337 family)